MHEMKVIAKIGLRLLLVCMGLPAIGQEVLISDSERMIPPFEGCIGYRLTYEGKVDPAAKPYLPDSMTMYVGKNGLRCRYHGGLSADLQSEMLWDGDTQALWLLDQRRMTAQYPPERWKGFVSKPKRLEEKPVTGAGRPCTAWTLSFEKHVEKVWVNDSLYFGGRLVDTLSLYQPAFLAAGMRQIPLMTRRIHAEGVVTLLRAVSILPGVQDGGLFQVPDGYRKIEFDPTLPVHPILQRQEH
jgi:hypothetical protein